MFYYQNYFGKIIESVEISIISEKTPFQTRQLLSKCLKSKFEECFNFFQEDCFKIAGRKF